MKMTSIPDRRRGCARRSSSHSVSRGGSAEVASSRIRTRRVAWRAPWRSRRPGARRASAGAPPTSGLQAREAVALEEFQRLAPQLRLRRPCASRVSGSRRNQMFCSTVRSGTSDSSWNTAEMPARLRRRRDWRRGRPRRRARILPASGRTAPARIWMKVLLPAPFSPSSACTSPARALKSARSARRCRRSASKTGGSLTGPWRSPESERRLPGQCGRAGAAWRIS